MFLVQRLSCLHGRRAEWSLAHVMSRADIAAIATCLHRGAGTVDDLILWGSKVYLVSLHYP